ncbi:epimerase [Candidatus Beckwithbacteria bacterium CG_4_9_14_0_2_um_filter_47_11]|uniref:Epimerase n=1 Tax=Candidatus Beckwithbacteria bacterium CG_4_9_14_0_2_um_filter_47_11 TaxID=1974494 RepID=A0A2M8G4R4_9BACT|nr:MAG: epimerase [Candidatus Beckwithbacteria bacterium CG_4_9_14_0_2_um_filter_47_11]
MKIIVFGATGKTGKEVVKQALAQGDKVAALVRNPKKMDISHENLSLVQGDVLDGAAVDWVIKGTDGVIVALGASADMQSDIVMAQGTANIISSMKKHSVKRLIVQSSYAMSGSPEGIELLKSVGMGEEQIDAIRPVLDDKAKQEKIVRASGLEFVIVRPTMLTDTEKSGKYRVGEKLTVKPGEAIARADVADFMLKSLISNEWREKTVTISY